MIFVFWQCLTIICMVFWTISILHSSTWCYVMSCCFVSFSKQFSHKKSIYIAAYVLIVLHFANKRSHDFSVKKVVTLISYCLNIIVSIESQGYSHLFTVDSQEKSSWSFGFCFGCLFWVLHLVQVSATRSCTTKGHPVVLFSEKGLNVEDSIVAPTYGCHICPSWNFWNRNSCKRIKC